MPLSLAEQCVAADKGGTTSETLRSTGAEIVMAEKTAAEEASVQTKRRLLPEDTGVSETESPDEEKSSVDASCSGGVERIEARGDPTPPSSCASPCTRRRRLMASRARICGFLVERGARRAWRRSPSEKQVALDKKYSALLEDDDGRNLCTFSG